MRRRLGVPLAAAILVAATALPAVASKPEPTAEAVSHLELPTSCVIGIEVSVPVGGKRVHVVEAGGVPWSDGKFLNGTTSVLRVPVTAGDETVDVYLFDPQGRQVHQFEVAVSCVVTAPRPPAT